LQFGAVHDIMRVDVFAPSFLIGVLSHSMSSVAHLSLNDYDRMIESGVFDGARRRRLEFIYGEIREMAPIGPSHEEVVARLNEWSILNLPVEKIRIRVQSSIGLPELESAPQPDIAWVKRRDYSKGRPVAADVLLIIEVAESSWEYDCGEKADLYAAAGISEYWVVNLNDRTVEVRREPSGGRYRSLQTYSGDQEIRPLASSETALRPVSLWET
jgi:Uma2 family endonuclease